MTAIRYTRNLFLRGMSIVYLFAFTSLYIQIPGLYGSNGILPARTQLDSKASTLTARIHNKPTLLWLAPYMGLDTEYMMDVLALFGVFLAFTGLISQKFCTAPMFAGLWSLYYSLYQVGQTFMWFQWDLLLLEAGFLCILVAPLRYRPVSRRRPTPLPPSDPIAFWMVRWLLFRLMFSSGVVKLTSGCPTWWSLSALSIHFQSQCIPTPLAWYSHHLPEWILKLSTVAANVIEMGIPFLFFFPLRGVRISAFYVQVPFSHLHPAANNTVVPAFRTWHSRLDHLHLTNSYGLFRRMTGVDGRPEVILEGSNHIEGPWKEYNFLYKPGNVNSTPPFVAPHQPRLDWQMWFAALGTYHQNPWLMGLTYRLLNGQPEVLQLLDSSKNPFPNKPPKYIKASLYHYQYTPWNQRWSEAWWTRSKQSEYLPIFSRDHPPLLEYLRKLKILSDEIKEPPVVPWLKYVLDRLRFLFSQVEPSILLWSIFSAGCVINLTSGTGRK
ncbi:Lipase maturation factor [Gryllus bimaculatus]|nr:Lipase maturation factor [Gryllus bimaculatus]